MNKEQSADDPPPWIHFRKNMLTAPFLMELILML